MLQDLTSPRIVGTEMRRYGDIVEDIELKSTNGNGKKRVTRTCMAGNMSRGLQNKPLNPLKLNVRKFRVASSSLYFRGGGTLRVKVDRVPMVTIQLRAGPGLRY